MKKIIVAIAAFAMLTGSAYAADWNFYGSARVDTFWTDVDAQTPGVDDAKNVQESLMGTSRIGATVKVSDELTGRFEYGGTVNMRLLYGEWNFGAGTFLVGQDYTPIRLPHSNQAYADQGLGDRGELGSLRAAQLKLRFGGFQVALVRPDTGLSATSAGNTTEVKIPQLAAKYVFAGENWGASVLGGYGTFDVNDESVNSYVLGLGANVAFGAVNLAASIHGGENIGNLAGSDTGGAYGDGYAHFTGTTVQDVEAFGYKLVAGYAVNDMFGLEVGYGYAETEIDIAGSSSDEVQSYYLQAPITMAPGVIVVPEIGVIDYKEDGQSDTTYFGAKWQINF